MTSPSGLIYPSAETPFEEAEVDASVGTVDSELFLSGFGGAGAEEKLLARVYPTATVKIVRMTGLA